MLETYQSLSKVLCRFTYSLLLNLTFFLRWIIKYQIKFLCSFNVQKVRHTAQPRVQRKFLVYILCLALTHYFPDVLNKSCGLFSDFKIVPMQSCHTFSVSTAAGEVNKLSALYLACIPLQAINKCATSCNTAELFGLCLTHFQDDRQIKIKNIFQSLLHVHCFLRRTVEDVVSRVQNG